MPNALQVQLELIARDLISQHGRPVELVERSITGDAWNPVVGAETTTPIIALNTKKKWAEDPGLKGQYDTKFLLDSQVKPELSMRLRDNGVDYSIVAAQEIMPGETTMVHKVWCAC